MNVRYLIVLSFLLTITVVHAAQSAESVVVRVAAYNAATKTYTFTCDIPANADPHRYWTIRPDTPELETQFYTDARSMTYTLSKDAMYHIGCQVNNGTSAQQQWIRGDFHIDRRTGPNTNKPEVTAQSTNGISFTMTCNPPPGVTNYDITWRAIGAVDNVLLPGTQKTLSGNVPYPGLWDITCGIWDKDRSSWSQWGFPTEFFASGQAYTPTASGCIPGESCGGAAIPPANTTNSTNTTNTTTPPTIPPNGSCYSSLQSMPSSCTGIVTHDDFKTAERCRYIGCAASANTLEIKACEKNTFFEMYKVTSNGKAPKICIGTTCLSDGGYAKSGNYPLCFGNTTAPPNSTNNTTAPPNTTNPPSNTSVSISIAQWYPQGRNYIFICKANATSFNFVFGDGHQQLNSPQNNVYHTYANAGGYSVTCAAKGITAAPLPIVVQ